MLRPRARPCDLTFNRLCTAFVPYLGDTRRCTHRDRNLMSVKVVGRLSVALTPSTCVFTFCLLHLYWWAPMGLKLVF